MCIVGRIANYGWFWIGVLEFRFFLFLFRITVGFKPLTISFDLEPESFTFDSKSGVELKLKLNLNFTKFKSIRISPNIFNSCLDQIDEHFRTSSYLANEQNKWDRKWRQVFHIHINIHLTSYWLESSNSTNWSMPTRFAFAERRWDSNVKPNVFLAA